MQLSLRPYVTAGVAVLGASLIAVTPVLATRAQQPVEQHAVDLAATSGAVEIASLVPAAAGGTADAGATTTVAATLGDELSHWLYIFAPDVSHIGFQALASDMNTWAADLTEPALQATLATYMGPTVSAQMVAEFGPSNVMLQFLGAHPAVAEVLLTIALWPARAAQTAAAPLIASADLAGMPAALSSNVAAAQAAVSAEVAAMLGPGALAGLSSVFDPAMLADIGAAVSTGLTDVPGMLLGLLP